MRGMAGARLTRSSRSCMNGLISSAAWKASKDEDGRGSARRRAMHALGSGVPPDAAASPLTFGAMYVILNWKAYTERNGIGAPIPRFPAILIMSSRAPPARCYSTGRHVSAFTSSITT